MIVGHGSQKWMTIAGKGDMTDKEKTGQEVLSRIQDGEVGAFYEFIEQDRAETEARVRREYTPLAETVIEFMEEDELDETACSNGFVSCRYCEAGLEAPKKYSKGYPYEHKENCPVLLARQLLNPPGGDNETA